MCHYQKQRAPRVLTHRLWKNIEEGGEKRRTPLPTASSPSSSLPPMGPSTLLFHAVACLLLLGSATHLAQKHSHKHSQCFPFMAGIELKGMLRCASKRSVSARIEVRMFPESYETSPISIINNKSLEMLRTTSIGFKSRAHYRLEPGLQYIHERTKLHFVVFHNCREEVETYFVFALDWVLRPNNTCHGDIDLSVSTYRINCHELPSKRRAIEGVVLPTDSPQEIEEEERLNLEEIAQAGIIPNFVPEQFALLGSLSTFFLCLLL